MSTNVDCTLTIVGVSTSQEEVQSILRLLETYGASWAHTVALPTPGNTITNTHLFDNVPYGNINSGLSLGLLQHGLSFVWMASEGDENARTVTIGTPTGGIFDEALSYDDEMFVPLSRLHDRQRIATLQARNAIMHMLLDQGVWLYTPSAHARLAKAARQSSCEASV